MTRDEIVALFALHLELWNQHDADGLTALHADDGVVVSPLGGGTITGHVEIAKVYRHLFQASPDLRLERDQLLIDGDRVALFGAFAGTDRGGFMGMPPTNRALHTSMAFFYQLENGRIAYERRVYDYLAVLIQAGVLKAKPV